MNKKLFHKDFTMMVIGQIISIFGNSILRFAISLYVLDLTGSASIFAGILAISMLPTILLSPDVYKRQALDHDLLFSK